MSPAAPVKNLTPAQALEIAAGLQRQGRRRDAEAVYFALLQADPGNAAAIVALGLLRLSDGDPEAAVAMMRQAIRIDPRHFDAHNNLGAALQALNRHEEALESHRAALALNPDFADGYNNLGTALQVLGRFAEAGDAFEQAVRIAPDRPAYYRNLFYSRRVAADEPTLAGLELLARDPEGLPWDQQIDLHFAVGKAYADLEQHERAFHHLATANALRRREVVYDEGNMLRYFERLRKAFGPERMRTGGGCGDPSEVPIFILGMPRSGTSLVEQILASHPRVYGAGELRDLEQLATRFLAAPGRPRSLPEVAARAPGESFTQLGRAYVARLREYAPDAACVTDKMPGNFYYVGLIRLALPHARIIHVTRDPVDTCFSCFSIPFSSNLPYLYELGEIARYYRCYEGLMQHWREVLPAGTMLEVRYEDVVADLEGQARRLVAYCGLDWAPACLAFHRTDRPIRTASSWQARQPLYRNSVGRWRAYRNYLQPLLAALQAP